MIENQRYKMLLKCTTVIIIYYKPLSIEPKPFKENEVLSWFCDYAFKDTIYAHFMQFYD